MIYPKIRRINNRYRGPVESIKQINITNDIINAINELKLACKVLDNKANEIYNSYTNNDYNNSISNVSTLIKNVTEMEKINYGQ